jgi:hypothetical protein
MKIPKWIAWFFIPKGTYCDKCPFWRPRIAPIEIGDREIAYCIYLDQTDLDICKEREDEIWESENISEGTKTKSKGSELPMSFSSLLWDGCKECGIKENDWRDK